MTQTNNIKVYNERNYTADTKIGWKFNCDFQQKLTIIIVRL